MLKSNTKIENEEIQDLPALNEFSQSVGLKEPTRVIIHETSVDIPISREMITAPIFARCKKNKINHLQVYFLNKQKTRKIEIKPPFNDFTNTEFEERVFMALIDIAKRQQIFLHLPQLPQKIYTTISQIIKTMDLKYNTRCKNRVYQALKRLNETHYSFSNCYYSAELDEYKEEENSTILSRFHYKSFLDVEGNNPEIIEYFKQDRRIQEFVYVEISSVFYNNLIDKRAYLNFDSRSLLDIGNSIARKIYMYCDRQRWQDDAEYKQKGDDLRFRITLQVLIQVIPLSSTPKGMLNTFQTVKDAFEYLVRHNLLKNFIIHQENPLKNTWFEVFFFSSRKYKKEEKKYMQVETNLEPLGVFSEETRLTNQNNELKSKWEEFCLFYLGVYKNDFKLSEFNILSKEKLLKDFTNDKFSSICLANYVINKAKDINAYLSKSEHVPYVSEQDVIKLKNNHEKKLKELDKEKEKKLKIEQLKQQEIINQQLIENEFNKMTDNEKNPYLKYVEYLLDKKGAVLSSFLNTNIDIKSKLLFIIFAKSTNRAYDPKLEGYLEIVESIKLDIRNLS